MQHGSLQLRDWQRRTGLNQRQAALKLGLHYTSYNQLLTRRRLPGRDLAVRIQDAAGIPVVAWTPSRVGSARSAKESGARSGQRLQGANANGR